MTDPRAMIVLTVESLDGAPAEPRSASFDELGGTIGRQESNQLVLRGAVTVSRVHARVVFRNGAFNIVDQGSNPVLINGRTLGAGREAPLKNGDRLEIGGYVLRVSMGQAPRAPDVFETSYADLFGGAPAPAPASGAPIAPPTPAAPSLSPRGASSAAIPDDWDDFTDTRSLHTPPAPTALPPIDMTPREKSIDELFGLGGADAGPAARQAAPPQAMRDDLPEIHSPFPGGFAGGFTGAKPRAAESATPPPTSAPRAPLSSGPGAAGGVHYKSWEHERPDGPEGRTIRVTRVGASASASAAAPAPAATRPPAPTAAPAPVAQALAPAAASAAATPAPVSTRAASPSGVPTPGDATPLAALLEGLGLADMATSQLDARQARMLGAALRLSMHGTVQLLQGRAAFKRGLRSEVTTIRPRENNPLKFSADAETALRQFLREPGPGYLDPEAAVRDAYEDLQAHQLALMAGMRSALEGLLGRFDPAALESKITPPGGLAGLLPSARKAQLWEQFGKLYGQLAREAEDGFHELFASQFVQAYEAEIRRLRQQPAK